MGYQNSFAPSLSPSFNCDSWVRIYLPGTTKYNSTRDIQEVCEIFVSKSLETVFHDCERVVLVVFMALGIKPSGIQQSQILSGCLSICLSVWSQSRLDLVTLWGKERGIAEGTTHFIYGVISVRFKF